MGSINRKIKILYTIPNFNTAGSGKVLYDLAKGLDKERFDVSIVCNHDKGLLFQQVKALCLPIYLIDASVPLRPYYNLFFRLKLFKDFVRTHEFDIVHSWHYSSDWTEALAVRLVGVKWLYTKKAMGFNHLHWKIRSYLANFVITINTEMRVYFPYKKQQALIPLGIDTGYYNGELFNVVTPIDDAKFNIITVANLVPVKGVEVLLKALEFINNKNITLTILGDNSSPYGNSLAEIAVELKLDQQVVFLGKKADVRPFIAQADLYIIPTLDEGRKEGMPMALVEAMSMGISVLGSDISGINYVLKDFPELLFPASDIKELCAKIESLYNKTPNERLLLGQALRRYCETHFSMETFINAHENLYLKLTK
ncbi:MAG: glycosyltransferase family 4 protein [Gelidibacter sp.]